MMSEAETILRILAKEKDEGSTPDREKHPGAFIRYMERRARNALIEIDSGRSRADRWEELGEKPEDHLDRRGSW